MFVRCQVGTNEANTMDIVTRNPECHRNGYFIRPFSLEKANALADSFEPQTRPLPRALPLARARASAKA